MLEGPDEGKRFVANMEMSAANIQAAMVDDLMDVVGSVTTDADGKCTFAVEIPKL